MEVQDRCITEISNSKFIISWDFGINHSGAESGILKEIEAYVMTADVINHVSPAEPLHYNDVIMTAMPSQITSLTIVYSTVYSAQIKENIKAPRHWHILYRPNITHYNLIARRGSWIMVNINLGHKELSSWKALSCRLSPKRASMTFE